MGCRYIILHHIGSIDGGSCMMGHTSIGEHNSFLEENNEHPIYLAMGGLSNELCPTLLFPLGEDLPLSPKTCS
eukprot:9480330-Pyramimonas_sp.AAC.1